MYTDKQKVFEAGSTWRLWVVNHTNPRWTYILKYGKWGKVLDLKKKNALSMSPHTPK